VEAPPETHAAPRSGPLLALSVLFSLPATVSSGGARLEAAGAGDVVDPREPRASVMEDDVAAGPFAGGRLPLADRTTPSSGPAPAPFLCARR